MREEVFAIVRSIPSGKVTSYGKVAAAIGKPRAARVVGGILGSITTEDVPWWRVVNQQCRISIVHPHVPPEEQTHRLTAEGVRCERRDTPVPGFYVIVDCFWEPEQNKS
jgi:methylated-DNA-protein-cysteine methyltransferase related protein